MNKTAYPMKYDDKSERTPYDLEKWVATLRGIETLISVHANSPALAFDRLTKDMPRAEKASFERWMKFYKTNEHMKYKSASSFFYSGDDGYILPIKRDQDLQATDVNPLKDLAKVEEETRQLEEENKRKQILKTKNKLISRLDATEKVLRSEDGHILAGEEFEFFIDTLYDLKKKIHKLNKKSTSTRLYEDMIVCAAGKSTLSGFSKSASIFQKLADDAKGLSPAPVVAPTVAHTIVAPEAEKEIEDGISELMERTNPADSEDDDESHARDDIEFDVNDARFEHVQDTMRQTPSDDDIYSFVQGGNSSDILNRLADKDFELTVFAQATDVKPSTETKPPPPAKAENVTPAHIDRFDEILNSALKSVTVSDIVKKLEMLTNIHHAREIPGQLARLDMMLRAKGLNTVFPQLSEAINKSLEANNYVATRLDEILSSIRSIETTGNSVDLEPSAVAEDTESQKIKGALTKEQKDDEDRKKARKRMENEKVDQATQPKEDIELVEPTTGAPEVSTKEPTPPASVK